MSKSKKVWLALSVELIRQVIEVIQAVSQNGTSLIIKAIGAVEVVDHTTTDNGVDGH
ncbi:MAG: hypothetical protein OEW32_14285 [Nitrospira sp.]|nr:hypothetical protein [Nitrospira sp.]